MNVALATWPSLTLAVGTVAWVSGTRLQRGLLVSPYSIILLMLVSIFGIRPLLMLSSTSTEAFRFYGYDISSGYALASMIGFIGVAAFITGYLAGRIFHRSPAPPNTISNNGSFYQNHPNAPEVATLLSLVLLGVWFLIMIVVGGGPSFIALLFAGRSEAVSIAIANAPSLIFALPVVAALLVAHVRFEMERDLNAPAYSRLRNVFYWTVAGLTVIPPSALGTRRFLIPSLVIVVVGALSRSWSRPIRAWWVIAGGAGFLALAVFPFVRSSGSRIGGSTDLMGSMVEYIQREGVSGILDSFFLSFDTEMFNYVAYFAPRMGEAIPFGLGRGTLGDLIAQPLPAAMSLPVWNDYLLTFAFGGGCGDKIACPVPSIIGVLFTDLSYGGLIIGMIALGLLSARFSSSLFTAHGWYVAVLLLVSGFSVVFARGNSMSQLWYGFQIFVVWAILFAIVKRWPTIDSRTISRVSRRASVDIRRN